jgi:hypothetical protein
MERSAGKVDDFRLLIESGDVVGMWSALASEPALANRTIRWLLNQQNESDSIHYVSDCFFHGRLNSGKEGEIAEVLLAHVADNADIEARCTEFGATPLFWAVHGYDPNGPKQKKNQVGAARILIQARARIGHCK